MKKYVFLLALLAWAAPAFAQAPPTEPAVVDHWWTSGECQAAPGPYYVPRVKTPKCPLKSGEQIVGHETGGCFKIDLPKEDGSIGWVRLQLATRVVRNVATGKDLRIAECCNGIHGFAPFTPAEKPALTPVEVTVKLDESKAVPEAIDRASSRLSKSIADAAAELAARQAAQAANRGSQPRTSGGHFWNPKTTKRRVLLGTTVAGIVGGAFCAKYCKGDVITQEVTVSR